MYLVNIISTNFAFKMSPKMLNVVNNWCIAQTFFKSLFRDSFSLAYAALAFATPPQNMHKLLSYQRCRSSFVSFPSLLSLSARGLVDAEEVEADADFAGLLPLLFFELMELLFDDCWFFLSSGFLLDLLLLGLSLDLPLPEQDFSWRCTQWQESIVWVRTFMASIDSGLACCPIMSLIHSTKLE